MAPIQSAFAAGWPEARLVNLLDDGLTSARAAEGQLGPATKARFFDLASYAYKTGADAILFTCSAFGPAIEEVAAQLPIPVLKPNEAMFEAAMKCGDRIGMIVTFAPAAATMEAEFAADATRCGSGATVESLIVSGAMEALRAGDAGTHDRLILDKADALSGFNAVMLAQFSTSRVASALKGVTRTPILTSPDSAVAKLRRMVAGS